MSIQILAVPVFAVQVLAVPVLLSSSSPREYLPALASGREAARAREHWREPFPAPARGPEDAVPGPAELHAGVVGPIPATRSICAPFEAGETLNQKNQCHIRFLREDMDNLSLIARHTLRRALKARETAS